MNTNLNLATSQNFGNIQCDFWSDTDNNFWMTRDQIGTALGYPEPRKAIQKIHDRHQDRFTKVSTVVSLGTVEGERMVNRDVIVYSARGVFEICRWSRQPKADEFMDWVWEIVDGLRVGKYKLSEKDKNVPYIQMINNLNQNQSLLMQELDKLKSNTELNTDSILDLAYQFDDVKTSVLPKTDAYDTFMDSKGLLSLNRVAKSLGIGRNKMMEILRSREILFKDGYDNIPYEKFVQAGYFVAVNKTGRDGNIHTTTKVTAKGVMFIFEILNQS